MHAEVVGGQKLEIGQRVKGCSETVLAGRADRLMLVELIEFGGGQPDSDDSRVEQQDGHNRRCTD